ncbi:uncharacterized protein I303_100909 [Kwoniella dejecticola CBS 10117]|uniref:Uncharacterized protein n=1 Tax=Kwoniella dejecticola CBS 10117 TaxID=1296121 RepID=A0A1A6AGC4_9TREE|nr:uncharacterized protein I303_00913 [Kwoniella dejecticola CBS 10117]OBR89091.1 hypothetical protein I303_00913 [Kwoniella dejecticola CBS 10117]
MSTQSYFSPHLPPEGGGSEEAPDILFVRTPCDSCINARETNCDSLGSGYYVPSSNLPQWPHLAPVDWENPRTADRTIPGPVYTAGEWAPIVPGINTVDGQEGSWLTAMTSQAAAERQQEQSNRPSNPAAGQGQG